MTRARLLNDAIRLLDDDNLVWSADFEAVRKPLARLLETHLWAANSLGLAEALAVAEAVSESDNNGLIV